MMARRTGISPNSGIEQESVGTILLSTFGDFENITISNFPNKNANVVV